MSFARTNGLPVVHICATGSTTAAASVGASASAVIVTFETPLAVFVPASSPVTVVAIVMLTLVTSLVITSVLVHPATTGSESASVDVLNFLVTVLLLAHDLQFRPFEGGFGVKSEERFGHFLSLKFDKDAALEELLVGTA